jgi:hypothetical protein
MTSAKSLLLPAVATLAFGLAAPSHAVLVTWDNGDGGGNAFELDNNWDTNTAPVSGVDDVLIGSGIGNAQLNSAFDIASGKTFTGTGGQAVLRLAAGGHLTVKTGGTLDFSNAILAEAGNPTVNPQQLTFEAGATVSFNQYFDANSWVTTWEADATGVTEITVGLLFHRNEFIVDLTNYDVSNGTTLIIADYANYLPQTGSSIQVIGGKTGTVVTNYDKGGSDFAIAITNITPEPSSLALLGLGGLLVTRRRRG